MGEAVRRELVLCTHSVEDMSRDAQNSPNPSHVHPPPTSRRAALQQPYLLERDVRVVAMIGAHSMRIPTAVISFSKIYA